MAVSIAEIVNVYKKKLILEAFMAARAQKRQTGQCSRKFRQGKTDDKFDLEGMVLKK